MSLPEWCPGVSGQPYRGLSATDSSAHSDKAVEDMELQSRPEYSSLFLLLFFRSL
jgi:hypothetical protein